MVDVELLKRHMYDVVGAVAEVHRELGPGLNEKCYQEGLMMQLTEMGIPFQREAQFHPVYHGQTMSTRFQVDFLCKGDIVLECKSVLALGQEHRAQLFNYMRLLGSPCGMLVNFAPSTYELERYFLDPDTNTLLTTAGDPLQYKKTIFQR